jgi:hypothetical protein
MGEKIAGELAENNPALLVLDRGFETQSVHLMFLELESGMPGMTRAAES